MRIELSNSLEELKRVMAALEAFSESEALGLAATQAVELALDELLSNVISYGCPGPDQHVITVELYIEGDTLKLVVGDDGIPFNPFEQEDPDLGLAVEEREPGGVGIYLVKKLMDEYAYERVDERNIVTLRKGLAKGQG